MYTYTRMESLRPDLLLYARAPTRCRTATVQYSSGRDTGFTASLRALSVSWRLTDFLVVAKP
jgi:hypothetical protein